MHVSPSFYYPYSMEEAGILEKIGSHFLGSNFGPHARPSIIIGKRTYWACWNVYQVTCNPIFADL